MEKRAFSILWAVSLAVMALTAIGLWVVDVPIKRDSACDTYFMIIGAWLLVTAKADIHGRFKPILAFGHGFLLFVTITITGSLVSYFLARVTTTPFVDPWLYRSDAAFGFDWLSLYHWQREQDALIPLLRVCYASIGTTPNMILLGLAIVGQPRQVFDFLMAFAVALALALGLFIFFPAETTIPYLLGTNPSYMPSVGVHAGPVISGLRDGSIHQITLGGLVGLISFPSFHAASAVIYAWAAWPIRVYRYPLLAVNAVMLAATPIEGAHYLVDIMGGLLVAGVAIWVATRLRRGAVNDIHPSIAKQTPLLS